MSTRAIIFDRDGVLTYFDFAPARELLHGLTEPSFADLRDAWDTWYQRTPPPRSLDAEHRYMAGFWDSVCDRFALSAAVAARLREFEYTRTLRPFDDARPALESARAHGLRIAVLSNFPLPSLEASLHAAGLGDLIDAVCAAPLIGARKPDAAAYRYALDALGVAPHECAMIDDEQPCVEGARAVGIRAFWLDRRGKGAGGAGELRDLRGVPHAVTQSASEHGA